MTTELQWQNVATDKLNNSVLYLLGIIEEPPWICSWSGAASLTKQDRAGALSLFLRLPCSHSGRKYDRFISSHYWLCFFIQYGIYFLLEICSSFSLLCSKTGSIQLSTKHFFRDQRQTACPGMPLVSPCVCVLKDHCGHLTLVLSWLCAVVWWAAAALSAAWEHVAMGCTIVEFRSSHRCRI